MSKGHTKDELIEIWRKAFEKSTMDNLRLRAENDKLREGLDAQWNSWVSGTYETVDAATKETER